MSKVVSARIMSSEREKDEPLAGYVKGECLKMCPDAEAKFRESNKLLSIFETLEGTERCGRPRSDPERCVKEFRRSAAGEKLNNPKHLRPPAVLLRTVNYLLSEIAPRKDVPFSLVYDFVFDRLRSVRQDMSIQQLGLVNPTFAATILEKCIQFYIFINLEMQGKDMKFINKHIHRDHTQQCFRSLVEIYGTLEKALDSTEYVACYLLHNLGSHDVLFEVLAKFSTDSRSTFPLDTTIQISLAFLHNNFVGMFKHLSRLKANGQYLVIAALVDNISLCQSKAIEVLSYSHSSKLLSFPTNDLVKWLYLDNPSNIYDLAKCHGMTVNPLGNICFLKSNFISPESYKVGEVFFLKGVDTMQLL